MSIENKFDVVKQIVPLARRNANILISFKGGIKFWIRDYIDIGIVYEVFGKNVYHSLFAGLSRKILYIDIGGYIGDSTVYASRVNNVKDIIVVEALPENLTQLKKNLVENHVQNTKIIHAAVAKKKGTCVIKTGKNRGMASIAFDYQTQGSIVVAIPLAQLIPATKHTEIVVKCDIEGAEYEVFLNTSIEVLSRITRVMIEFHVNQNSDEILLNKMLAHLRKAKFNCDIHRNKFFPSIGFILGSR